MMKYSVLYSQLCREVIVGEQWTCGTDLQPLDTENLFLFNEGSFNGLQAYKNSKAANIMFAYELARKLSGSGVKVNAVCPGKVIVQLTFTWTFYTTSKFGKINIPSILEFSYSKVVVEFYVVE